MSRQSSVSNSFRNSKPLSVRISPAPYRKKMLCIIARATVVANLSRRGIKTMYFENTQTAVKMYIYPFVDVGKGPARSQAQRSTGAPMTIGCRRPCLGASFPR